MGLGDERWKQSTFHSSLYISAIVKCTHNTDKWDLEDEKLLLVQSQKEETPVLLSSMTSHHKIVRPAVTFKQCEAFVTSGGISGSRSEQGLILLFLLHVK